MQSVVLTGTSSGIGYAIAKLLVKNNVRVFGSVRSPKDAERLQEDLGANYTPLIFDITEEDAVKEAALFVREKLQGVKLAALINNAGTSVPGPILFLPLSDFRKSFKVNLEGHIIVTQAFAPLLGIDNDLKGKPGKIINISSVVGKMAAPFFGASSISKHGMEALSDCLRIELMGFGIDVIVIEPGHVQSSVWDDGKALIPEQYLNSIYRRAVEAINDYLRRVIAKKALPAHNIAVLVLKILQNKTSSNSFVCMPQKMLNWTIPRLMPKRFIENAIAKKFKFIP